MKYKDTVLFVEDELLGRFYKSTVYLNNNWYRQYQYSATYTLLSIVYYSTRVPGTACYERQRVFAQLTCALFFNYYLFFRTQLQVRYFSSTRIILSRGNFY